MYGINYENNVWKQFLSIACGQATLLDKLLKLLIICLLRLKSYLTSVLLFAVNNRIYITVRVEQHVSFHLFNKSLPLLLSQNYCNRDFPIMYDTIHRPAVLNENTQYAIIPHENVEFSIKFNYDYFQTLFE